MAKNTTNSEDKSGSGVSLVVERAMFYRDGARNQAKISLILGVALIGSIALNAVAFMKVADRKHYYFATSPKGAIVPLTPLDKPLISDSRMLSLASDYATCVLTFDPVNFRSQISACKVGFTDNGWAKLIEAIKEKKLVELAQRDELILSTVKTDSPTIINKGTTPGGQAFWDVQVPVKSLFKGRGKSVEQPYLITLKVVRVDQTEYPDGIAIESYVAERRG